jgi:hypothetical protein
MTQKNNLENSIQEILLDGEILREKLEGPNYEFGFICSYPPGRIGQKISIFKPKQKNSLYIIIRFQISEDRIALIKSIRNRRGYQVFIEIQKFLLKKEMAFKIDADKFRFEIFEEIFIEKDDSIPVDLIFKGFQRVFYGNLYTNILIDEYCNRVKDKNKK